MCAAAAPKKSSLVLEPSALLHSSHFLFVSLPPRSLAHGCCCSSFSSSLLCYHHHCFSTRLAPPLLLPPIRCLVAMGWAWIQIGRRLGEANGWVKELERRVTMTGRSRPLWCSGAVGKKVVGCVPEGAGGGASKPDSAMERTVVAAQPRPLYRKRSAHHQTEVPVILIEQEAPTGDGEPATPRPSKRIPVLCTHLVRWSLFSVPCTTPDEDGEQWRNCAAHVAHIFLLCFPPFFKLNQDLLDCCVVC